MSNTRHGSDPLSKVGDDVTWEVFQRASEQQRRDWSMGLTPSQRLEVGQRFSQEAIVSLPASLFSEDLVDLKGMMARGRRTLGTGRRR